MNRYIHNLIKISLIEFQDATSSDRFEKETVERYILVLEALRQQFDLLEKSTEFGENYPNVVLLDGNTSALMESLIVAQNAAYNNYCLYKGHCELKDLDLFKNIDQSYSRHSLFRDNLIEIVKSGKLDEFIELSGLIISKLTPSKR